jgi:signal transduction histidine kinase
MNKLVETRQSRPPAEELVPTVTPPGLADAGSQDQLSPLLRTVQSEDSKSNDGRCTTTVRDSSHQKQRKQIEPDIISVVSHELLSPLTLIKGYTATLLQFGETITEEQRRQYFRGIESATSRLVRLLENFRDISRLETGTSNLAVQLTSLPELLRKTITEIQSQTTRHVIKLRRFRPLPLVNVDRQKIEQLMTNLLYNAVKYSPQGGDIEVAVRLARDEERLRESLGEAYPPEPPRLIVTVTDPGIGIPEEDLERVFERFYRVDNRLTRATSGAGLGLYICKIIVEAHGGHIWARRKAAEGSTFGFSLPVDESGLRRQE